MLRSISHVSMNSTWNGPVSFVSNVFDSIYIDVMLMLFFGVGFEQNILNMYCSCMPPTRKLLRDQSSI